MNSLWPSMRLLVRRCRIQILAWLLPLWALVASTAPSYEDVYPSLAEREMLVGAMRDSPGTRILYGILPTPGTIGQLVQWETGTYLVWCSGLMSILLTCRMMRGDEDTGLVEISRGTGVGRWVGFWAPMFVVWGTTALLGAGISGIMLAERSTVEELTVSGSLAFGASITITGWGFAALTALICQLGRDLTQARGTAIGAFGVMFGLRVAADDRDGLSWLRWVTPIGWRDIVQPFTDDSWAPVIICTLAALGILGIAGLAFGKRELLSGYLPDRTMSTRRWRVHGFTGLWVRLARGGFLGWGAGIGALAALFGAMTGSFTDMLAPDSPTKVWVDKMADGSAVKQLMTLLTTMTVLLVASAAVRRANTLAQEEREGLVELEIATGMSRARRYWVHLGLVVLEAIMLTGIAAGSLAWVTSSQLTTDHAVARAAVFVLTQIPGVLAAIGLAMAIVGLVPRLASVMWVVIGWSLFAQSFGGLVDLPDWARDLSIVGHCLDVVGDPDWVPLAVQAGIAIASLLVGFFGFSRRDVGS